MANQTLGGYTFTWNPDKWTPPIADKFAAGVKTYSSADVFDWGNTIVGKEILLEWDWISYAQVGQIETLKASVADLVWNPQTGIQYNVHIMDFRWEFFDVVALDSAYRQKAKLLLKIMSQV